ncbi:unnamed protein product [Owenia fusiformis]|uniref:Kazal-like domain-containing protein n=1 Tax=Owenia fusiformis TaxID=6347 RepID=A0A8S4NJ97_OWEFU|nr:unnamed protein product [Owenia fusiformis]
MMIYRAALVLFLGVFYLACIIGYVQAGNKAQVPTRESAEDTQRRSRERPECPTACPMIYNPICAYDGEKYVTFPSQCDMTVHACKTGKLVTPQFRGPCEEREL